MAEIVLAERHSVADVERRLERLAKAPEDADLLLPTALPGRALGGTSAVLQLIVTWRRRCPRGRLRVHVQETDDELQVRRVLERFVKRDHGLAATVLAERVWARSGERELTDEARPLIRARLADMRSLEGATRGAKVFVACVDGTEFAAPPVIYQVPALRNSALPPAHVAMLPAEGWEALARDIDARLRKGLGPARLVQDVDSLTVVLRELLRNTHDWATRDERGERYAPWSSARGFRIERHNVVAADQPDSGGDSSQVARWLAHEELRGADGQQRFVELTIFDSGPGLAARMLATQGRDGAEPSLGDEDRAVRDCLRRRMSSSDEDFRGIGLARVLEMATVTKGFLRLRTGRLSLYRDFAAEPFRGAVGRPHEPFLRDWQGGATGPVAAAAVAGTFITALLPLVYA